MPLMQEKILTLRPLGIAPGRHVGEAPTSPPAPPATGAGGARSPHRVELAIIVGLLTHRLPDVVVVDVDGGACSERRAGGAAPVVAPLPPLLDGLVDERNESLHIWLYQQSARGTRIRSDRLVVGGRRKKWFGVGARPERARRLLCFYKWESSPRAAAICPSALRWLVLLTVSLSADGFRKVVLTRAVFSCVWTITSSGWVPAGFGCFCFATVSDAQMPMVLFNYSTRLCKASLVLLLCR